METSETKHERKDVSLTIRLRDVFYGILTVLNLVPVLLYLPAAQIDARDTPDTNFYLWMLSSGLAVIFFVNLLSMFQITFMPQWHRFYVVLVPFLMAIAYLLAASHALPRLLEPLSGRTIFPMRYGVWQLTVPVLLIQSGPLCGYPTMSFGWVAVLTNAYMMSAFGAMLAPTTAEKWLTICLTFGTWFTCIYDTACVVKKYKDGSPRYIYIMNGTFVVYGIIFLAAACDYISVLLDVVLFGILDIFTKVIFSSFMFDAVLMKMYKDMLLSVRYAEDIVDRSVAPMFVLRCGDGAITRWNDAMAQIVNQQSEDVVGKAFFKEFLGSSTKEAQDYFTHALGHNLPLDEQKKLVDIRIVQKKTAEKDPDKVIDLLLSINRIHNPEGEEVLMCIGQDVTEVRSFRMLEQKKAQMLAVVSHELRSPLHGIIGITDSAQKSATKSSQKRQLRLISDCAKRLVDFVSTMMDFTAMQKKGGEFTLNNDPVDIVKLLDDVVVLLLSANDKLGRPMAKKSVTIACAYRATRLPSMEGDSYRLTQVFFNIIGNALKFTEKGSVHVSTRVDLMRDGEKRVVVIVRDTGKGIHQNALARIFEPFEQEDSSDTRQHAGLGLGLAISREIVRKHGGDIDVESEVGGGSTFLIWLPVHQVGNESNSEDQSSLLEESTNALSGAPEDPHSSPPAGLRRSGSWMNLDDVIHNDARVDVKPKPLVPSRSNSTGLTGLHSTSLTGPPATIAESPVTTARQQQQRLRVLSVDDEPVNQEVIRGFFNDVPRFNVEFAMTGEEALEMLNASEYDVVLLDLMMPGMSGVEVLVKIRRAPKLSHLPVIMVSAKNQSDVISDALWKGATDFFVKPLDCVSLLARIDRILAEPQRGSGRSGREEPQTAKTSASGFSKDSGTPFHNQPPVYAALALAFVADSPAALRLLETVFTFVERTVELIAERTCRSADGSMLILAEGDDSEDRLRKIAQEVQAWFEENVGGGLRMSVGISSPTEIFTSSIGEQFVAMGSSVGVAIWRALNSAHGSLLREAATESSEILGGARLNRLASDASSGAIAKVSNESAVTVATAAKAPLDAARLEVMAGDLAQAQCLYRLMEILRAQCTKYETRLSVLSKSLNEDPGCNELTDAVKSDRAAPLLPLSDKSGADKSGADMGEEEIDRSDKSRGIPVAPPGVLSSVKKSDRLAQMKQKIGVEFMRSVGDSSDDAKFEASYARKEELGTGSSSSVYRALQKQTGRFVAVKRRRHVNEEVLAQVKQEFDLICLCKHRGVVNALDLIGPNLVLELLTGPSLAKVIEDNSGLNESDSRPLCKQLVEVVFYLHQKGVCHRDIKPANIHLIGEKLDTAILKLLDFNTACFYDRMATVTGTVAFMAPEIIKGWEYDERIDIYSVGVTAFMMLTNLIPYSDDEDPAANDAMMFVKQRLTGNFGEIERLSPQARSFIQLTLINETKSRPTARTLIAHMWLHEVL
jgi:signal transduction histidine kinase/DNA-binding NarL/FixJ family response regulator/predicted Ser/Thr protein kinase